MYPYVILICTVNYIFSCMKWFDDDDCYIYSFYRTSSHVNKTKKWF